jgi:hypothetical protein
MSLSHYRHSQFRRIEASLRRSDPQLAGMLGMFGRLCADQRMPTRSKRPPGSTDPAGAADAGDVVIRSGEK